MALSVRLKTKLLPALTNIYNLNILCASEFKNWDKMSLNGQNLAFSGLRVERPRVKFEVAVDIHHISPEAKIENS